jgi:phage terminase large subunit
VRSGIDAVKQRLAKAGDGKPRLFVVRDCVRGVDRALVDAHLPYAVEDEFPAYVWADKNEKEQPVKANDHGMDMVRYAVMGSKTIRQARSFQG